MRNLTWAVACLLIVSIICLSPPGCQNQKITHEEQVARTYCASCHVFPEAHLLTKRIWNESVLPEMAFRMGFSNATILSKVSPEDRPVVLATLPKEPMISNEDFEAIRRFYWNFADDLLEPVTLNTKPLQQFKPVISPFPTPFITMLQADTIHNKLWIGTQSGQLDRFDPVAKIIDTLNINSPPSHAVLAGDDLIVTGIGILMPNDQDKGNLIRYKDGLPQVLLDSLHRPVYFDLADLNGDGNPEFVVCNYGDYQGNLSIYSESDANWKVIPLSSTPGAIKTEIRDVNQDGQPDILALFAQGDERLVLYTNQGNLNFKEDVIHRFPPVYGSNYFETQDFNGDGYFDILMTNGDNGDFSAVVKPYHGIRLLQNDGQNQFTERLFLQMPGVSKAIMRDFDQDGDLDIAAISFFPDFETPEEGFIYFKNVGDLTFEPRVTPVAADGRWLTLEAYDFDQDGDDDLFLGSSSYRGLGANNAVFRHWLEKSVPLLQLENVAD